MNCQRALFSLLALTPFCSAGPLLEFTSISYTMVAYTSIESDNEIDPVRITLSDGSTLYDSSDLDAMTAQERDEIAASRFRVLERGDTIQLSLLGGIEAFSAGSDLEAGGDEGDTLAFALLRLRATGTWRLNERADVDFVILSHVIFGVAGVKENKPGQSNSARAEASTFFAVTPFLARSFPEGKSHAFAFGRIIPIDSFGGGANDDFQLKRLTAGEYGFHADFLVHAYGLGQGSGWAIVREPGFALIATPLDPEEVPEPGTAGLLGVSVAAMTAICCRRRRASTVS